VKQWRLVYKLGITAVASLLIILAVPLMKGFVRLFGSAAAHRFVFRLHGLVGWVLSTLYGIRIRVMGAENIPRKNGFIVIGNHVGYAELIAMLKIVPAVFVAKEEVKKWPLLGWVFRVGGEVFVDRESGGRSEEYAATVEESLLQGVNIFFAPEGTTSNGTILRRFKSPLFVPANRLKKAVLPFAYNVQRINGQPLSPENRDLLFWHSNMPFGPHFMEFLKLRSIEVVLNFGAPVIPDFDDSTLEGRRVFSAEMRARVEELYRPINAFYSGREE